jgi:crossover junction endodeoxyribonuclease RusA
MATFRLPLPPSSNRYWRTTRNGKVYVSEEAKAYRAEAGWLARAEGVEVLTGSVALTLEVWFTRKNGDLSNRVKVLEDALNGVAWVDDNQVSKLVAERFEVPKAKRGVKREGYVIVTVEAA